MLNENVKWKRLMKTSDEKLYEKHKNISHFNKHFVLS